MFETPCMHSFHSLAHCELYRSVRRSDSRYRLRMLRRSTGRQRPMLLPSSHVAEERRYVRPPSPPASIILYETLEHVLPFLNLRETKMERSTRTCRTHKRTPTCSSASLLGASGTRTTGFPSVGERGGSWPASGQSSLNASS